MRSKTRFIQREYSIGIESRSEYLVIVEIVEDVPVASYTVRVPSLNTGNSNQCNSESGKKRPNRIIQTDFYIENIESYENFMVLVFTEDNQVVATHTVRYPDWFRFHDKRFRFNLFSQN
jgi:hypothetical protein